MRTRPLQAAVLAAALGVAAQAGAALYDITFSSPEMTGSGQLIATPNGDGSYTVTSGHFQLNTGPYAGAAAALVPDPNPGPNPAPWTQVVYGGTDFIGLDDKLLPGRTAVLDFDGLLFNDTSFPRPGGAGLVFNLFYYQGSYQLLFNGYNNEPWATDYDGGTVTLIAVPEPTAIASAALLLLISLGGSATRILRKSRAP
jgi:hypothetical protein